MECYTCRSNSGEKRISPGPTIYDGTHWLVEHAYPSGLKGWLAIVLKRHVEALHDLTPEEFLELGPIMARVTKTLRNTLGCEKEYVMCLAEVEHFRHIHFHTVAKPSDLPDEFKGTKVFTLIKVTEQEAVPAEEIKTLCETLRTNWNKDWTGVGR